MCACKFKCRIVYVQERLRERLEFMHMVQKSRYSILVCLTLLRDVIICLMTMRSAKTKTFVTEERSKRAAFTIPVLSLNTVTRPSDWQGKDDPTSVNWAMASPERQEARAQYG